MASSCAGGSVDECWCVYFRFNSLFSCCFNWRVLIHQSRECSSARKVNHHRRNRSLASDAVYAERIAGIPVGWHTCLIPCAAQNIICPNYKLFSGCTWLHLSSLRFAPSPLLLAMFRSGLNPMLVFGHCTSVWAAYAADCTDFMQITAIIALVD